MWGAYRLENKSVALWQIQVSFKLVRIITHEETVAVKNPRKLKKDREKNEWTEKKMHGSFVRDMEDKDMNNTWRWMRKSNMKGCTEAMICSAQEKSIRTNYIKCNIDITGESHLCRM